MDRIDRRVVNRVDRRPPAIRDYCAMQVAAMARHLAAVAKALGAPHAWTVIVAPHDFEGRHVDGADMSLCAWTKTES